MAKLTLIDGKLRIDWAGSDSGSLVLSDSEEEPCCCECCNDNTIAYPCSVTVIHVDENRCEDDVFDIYVIGCNDKERFIRELDLVSSPPGCCEGYYASTAASCPQTRIEFDIDLEKEDFNDNCETTIQARFKRANCCNTLTRLTLVASNGAMITGSYFSAGGYTESWEADVLCGTTATPP